MPGGIYGHYAGPDGPDWAVIAWDFFFRTYTNPEKAAACPLSGFDLNFFSLV